MSVAGDAGRCCPLLLVDPVYSRRNSQLFFSFLILSIERCQHVLYWKLMFALKDFIKACPVGLTDSLSQRTLGTQMKGTVKLKSEKQQTTDSFNCFVLFVFCVCFVPRVVVCCFFAYALLVSSVCCLLRLFHSGCFLLRVCFHIFSRACFVPYVLFCVFRTRCFVPVRPSAPTITTCSPNGTVPANTAVSCTCTTGSVGQPQGRLKWVTNGRQITVGGYGSTTLQMTPQTLTLSDHDVKFHCDVDWVEDVTGQSFRASVGCE